MRMRNTKLNLLKFVIYRPPNHEMALLTDAQNILKVWSVLHTENVARGGRLRVSKNVGGKGVYNVLTFQKSRGARAHLEGGKWPPPPPPK